MAAAAVSGQYRRSKTTMFLIACCCAGAAPHWIDSSRSLLAAISLVFLLGGYGLKTVCFRDRDKALISRNRIQIQSVDPDSLPNVDGLVAARDEEAVIERLRVE